VLTLLRLGVAIVQLTVCCNGTASTT
jgi:hypothetical protein